MKMCAAAQAVRPALLLTIFVCSSGSHAGAQTLPSPWKASDIGSPSLSGTTTYGSGVFTIDGSGADVGGSSDEFHFVYQEVSGDTAIVARVDDLVLTHPWAKAGLMIRASLNASAANGFAFVSASNGIHFQHRASNGNRSGTIKGPSDGVPVWLRVQRAGTRVTAASSADGATWTTIGSANVELGISAYVGIAVTSHNTSTRTTAEVAGVTLRGSGQGLPDPQQSRDIGGPAVAGKAGFSSGTYTITAAGRDIWDVADQFHFVYQPLSGNGEIIARVGSLTNTHKWAKAGVMIRESLTADSRHAATFATPGAGYSFQRRPIPGEYSLHTTTAAGAPPGWVRLVRTGDTFEGYSSNDGRTWTPAGSDTIPMNETVYVGLAVTSHNESAATTASIDSFQVNTSTAPGNQPPAVSITSPANGSQFTGPATVAISASASDPENRMESVDFYANSTLIGRDSTAPYSVSWSASTAGTYSLTAVGHDRDGGTTTSSAVGVLVQSTDSPPRYVVFTASADHATNVTSYLFEVFASGASLSTATPVASSDLGKPKPASNGDITVDRATFFTNLAAGSYAGTVTAIGPGGRTRSGAISFTR